MFKLSTSNYRCQDVLVHSKVDRVAQCHQRSLPIDSRGFSICLIVFLLTLTFGLARGVHGQTLSPEELDKIDDLQLDGFLFRTEGGSRAVVPDISWEELERLKKLDQGERGSDVAYVIQSTEIQGKADRGTAELEVRCEIQVQPTGKRFAVVPLRMGNFFLTESPVVAGVDEHDLRFGRDESGFELLVKTAERTRAVVTLRVVTQVRALPSPSLELDLPDAPTKINLSVDRLNAKVELIGRMNETFDVSPSGDDRSRIRANLNGGKSTLLWDTQTDSRTERQLLEVESRMDVRWDSSQDQPIASISLKAKTTKGTVRNLRLTLPADSVLLDLPSLGAGGRSVEALRIEGQPQNVREITIPEDEQQNRIDLNFDLQLSGGNATASQPYLLEVPKLENTIRHFGQFSIKTGSDYRLRWNASSWVRREALSASVNSDSLREYQFVFDRASFRLPIWLSTTDRQSQLTTRSQLTIERETALLRMRVSADELLAAGRLQLEHGDWTIRSIVRSGDNDPVDFFKADQFQIIELDPEIDSSNLSLDVTAERSVAPDAGSILFRLPRFVAETGNSFIQNATLDLISSGRSVLVVDLDSSAGISRTVNSAPDSASGEVTSRFRVTDFDGMPVISGTLKTQSPQISISSNAKIVHEKSRLRTEIDWDIESSIDLEGSLPVRMPSVEPQREIAGEKGVDTATSPDGNVDKGKGSADFPRGGQPSTQWRVTVDNVPAALRTSNDGTLRLVSDRLSIGASSVSWQSVVELPSEQARSSEVPVDMPWLDESQQDVTLRGSFNVELIGTAETQLLAASSFASKRSAPDAKAISLNEAPNEPLRIQVFKRDVSTDELSVKRTIIRSLIGFGVRQEQLLLTIEGSGELMIRVRDPDEIARLSSDRVGNLAADMGNRPSIQADAYLDGRPLNVVQRQDFLIVGIDESVGIRRLDLRVWMAGSSSANLSVVSPLLELPVARSRTYWQVITPETSHAIWSAPTMGRSMQWIFDQWRLIRQPVMNDEVITAGFTGPGIEAPTIANRYLYVGADSASFKIFLMSKSTLWLFIAATVFFFATTFGYVSAARMPFALLALTVGFAGFIVAAPDAAIIAGQVGTVAIALVGVTKAIRALVSPGQSDRVFSPNGSVNYSNPSTHQGPQMGGSKSGNVSETRSIPVRPPAQTGTELAS